MIICRINWSSKLAISLVQYLWNQKIMLFFQEVVFFVMINLKIFKMSCLFFLVNNWPNKVLSNSSSLIKIKSQVSDVHNYIFITVILNIKSSSILCHEKFSFFHFFIYTIKKQDQLFGPHIVFVLDWQSDTCTRNWNLCSLFLETAEFHFKNLAKISELLWFHIPTVSPTFSLCLDSSSA